ncbi:hypothetical protein PR048_022090 [Dryococelus australis]|uniref:DDE-1 domain-containing protein n=1 Tax=Dryococelus australis TaxID=614101 RepID=A0ABQ9H015_9NEOP|nr:hypothetical protein PR048_022090 [Dryococelus australis]
MTRATFLTIHVRIYRRGVKYPVRICNHTKSATTVNHAVQIHVAPGALDTTELNMDGLILQLSMTGYFSTLLPHAEWLEGKVILIGDNLSSHLNENALQLCKANNIHFFCLPPNATHLCQPLDVAFFRTFKAAWCHELTAWKEKHPRVGVPLKHFFPSILSSAVRKMDSVAPKNPTDIKNGVSRNLLQALHLSTLNMFWINFLLMLILMTSEKKLMKVWWHS